MVSRKTGIRIGKILMIIGPLLIAYAIIVFYPASFFGNPIEDTFTLDFNESDDEFQTSTLESTSYTLWLKLDSGSEFVGAWSIIIRIYDIVTNDLIATKESSSSVSSSSSSGDVLYHKLGSVKFFSASAYRLAVSITGEPSLNDHNPQLVIAKGDPINALSSGLIAVVVGIALIVVGLIFFFKNRRKPIVESPFLGLKDIKPPPPVPIAKKRPTKVVSKEPSVYGWQSGIRKAKTDEKRLAADIATIQQEAGTSSPEPIEVSPVPTSSKPFLEKTTEAPVSIGASDAVSSEEPIAAVPPKTSAPEDKRPLFSSIQYQARELLFEQGESGPIVRIIPYSGAIKEFIVAFDQGQIRMKGCLIRPKTPLLSLELTIEGDSRKPVWKDLWKGIILSGEDDIIARIKKRSGIARQMTALGTAGVQIDALPQGEICLRITCREAKETIGQAYALMKDLQSFVEYSLY